MVVVLIATPDPGLQRARPFSKCDGPHFGLCADLHFASPAER
jgi:hypothetical protein